jgi:hypothetical protein
MIEEKNPHKGAAKGAICITDKEVFDISDCPE